MGGKRHRQKGDRIEREIVAWHRSIGIHAERYPLSGATRFRGSGHDLDLYIFGREEAPAVTEAKGRKDGAGSKLIRRWLGENDQLILKENREDFLVVMPRRTYERLVRESAGKGGMREWRVQNGNADVPGTSVPDRVSQDQRRLQDDPATQEE
jgi:hypothetical protein